jgi:hypothetical protein
MSLVDNLPIFMPLSPNPPSEEMQKISDALDFAILMSIQTQLVPSIGSFFFASLPNPNPFLISLATYLDSTVSPVISSAISVQLSSGIPAIAAWLTVIPSLSLIPSPVFMAGLDGFLFWSAIIQTIRLAIPVPEIPPEESSSSSSGSSGEVEVLRVES